MTLTVITVPGLAHWATYLVNDDATGLSEACAKEADAWFADICADHPFASAVTVTACSDEPYVANFRGLQSELLNYTIHVHLPSEVTVTVDLATMQRALRALLLVESQYNRFADQALPLSDDAFRNRVEAGLFNEARETIIRAMPKAAG